MEEVDEDESKRVADLIDKNFGIVEDIEVMPEKNKEFKEWSEKHKLTFETGIRIGLVRITNPSGWMAILRLLARFDSLTTNLDSRLYFSVPCLSSAIFTVLHNYSCRLSGTIFHCYDVAG